MRYITTLSLMTALVFALCVCAGEAWAGSPPLTTDDPGTPGAGGWEINLTTSIERTIDETELEAPLFDINYGPRDNDQIKVEFAVLSVGPDDENDEWGLSDVSIGYKYRFFENGPAGLEISTYPQVSLPTGDEDRGLGSGHTELWLPIQWQTDFGESGWINPQIGYNVVFGDNSSNSFRYGLAAGWEASEKLELMGEVAGVAYPEGPDPNDVYFNIGFTYPLNKNVVLLGSAGRSFYDRDRGTPDLTALFGVQLLFGPAAE